MKFGILIFFVILSINLKFPENITRTTSAAHEDLCTVMIVSR
jgi:hypothetical protein